MLSTSNTTSRSPAPVRRAAPGALGNLPGILSQARVQITSTTPRDRVREERAQEGPYSGQSALCRAGKAQSEPSPRTTRVAAAAKGAKTKGQRPRIGNVQAVHAKTCMSYLLTKACPNSRLDFKASCVSVCQNNKAQLQRSCTQHIAKTCLVGSDKESKANKKPASCNMT